MRPLFIPEILITGLLTAKGLKSFKNTFSLQADEFKHVVHEQQLNPDFKNIIDVTDEKGNEYNYKYHENYFVETISKMSKIYLKRLKIDSQEIYSSSARVNFLKQKTKEIHKVIDAYREVKHLNTKERALIIAKLESLSDRLTERMVELMFVKEDKITFNLNKNQVLMLFKLFHELDIIKGINIYDLMHFVERQVNFKNNQEIRNANKSLNTELARLKKSNSGKIQLDDTALLDLIKNILKI